MFPSPQLSSLVYAALYESEPLSVFLHSTSEACCFTTDRTSALPTEATVTLAADRTHLSRPHLKISRTSLHISSSGAHP